jgi:hypothetical protein
VFLATQISDNGGGWIGLAIVAVGVVAIYHIASESWRKRKAERAALAEKSDKKDSQLMAAFEAMVNGLDDLSVKLPVFGDAAKQFEATAKRLDALYLMVGEQVSEVRQLTTGMEAMCRAMAERTDALNKSVEILQASISPGGSLEDYSAFAEDTPEARRAAEQLEIAEIVRRGNASEEGAAARVRERNIYQGIGR